MNKTRLILATGVAILASCSMVNAQVILDTFQTGIQVPFESITPSFDNYNLGGTVYDQDPDLGEIRIEDGSIAGLLAGTRTWQYNDVGLEDWGFGDSVSVLVGDGELLWTYGPGDQATTLSIEYDLGAATNLGTTDGFFSIGINHNNDLINAFNTRDVINTTEDDFKFNVGFRVEDSNGAFDTITQQFLLEGTLNFDFADYTGIDFTEIEKVTVELTPPSSWYAPNVIPPVNVDPDIIIGLGQIYITPVPEPSTYAALALLVTLFGLMIRSKARQKQ
ncbi:MAG: PEP-CTERM sorting domain-containing protein [Puniceicoccaceae bacterium]